MPDDNRASAFGFMTLVAGLRLKQSRSWICLLVAVKASTRCAMAVLVSVAVCVAMRWIKPSASSGTHGRAVRCGMMAPVCFAYGAAEFYGPQARIYLY